jgi:hypothetical protein
MYRHVQINRPTLHFAIEVLTLDTQKKREAKKAEKAAKKATHKAADGGDAAQEHDDGPDISAGK